MDLNGFEWIWMDFGGSLQESHCFLCVLDARFTKKTKLKISCVASHVTLTNGYRKHGVTLGMVPLILSPIIHLK